MKAEIFDLSNLVSTEVIIINAVDRVALCLRGTSSQVVTVRLIICDGFFMRINEIEWGGEKKKHSPEKIQAQFHRVNMWTAVVNSAYQAAKKTRLFVLFGLKQLKTVLTQQTITPGSSFSPHWGCHWALLFLLLSHKFTAVSSWLCFYIPPTPFSPHSSCKTRDNPSGKREQNSVKCKSEIFLIDIQSVWIVAYLSKGNCPRAFF